MPADRIWAEWKDLLDRVLVVRILEVLEELRSGGIERFTQAEIGQLTVTGHTQLNTLQGLGAAELASLLVNTTLTLGQDPTAAMHAVTKQYADQKLSRVAAETIPVQHTFNPSTAGAPFLLGANAAGQLVTGLNADQVDGQHLADLDTRFVNAAGDSMSGALVVGTDPGGTELLRAQSLRAGSGVVGTWRPVGVIRPTTNVASVVFSGLSLSPPALLRLVAVIRPSATGAQNYYLRVNGETDSTDWAEQLMFASGTSVGGARTLDSSRIANFDSAGAFSVTHCSIVIAVASNGGVRASSIQSFADAADTPVLANFGLVKNTTISTLSSLSVVGPIAAGSVFYLEYLGP